MAEVLELVALDLASLASVRACADALLADGRPFDVVIANAGVMATPMGRTADGFETQFGTNHLGHFVLVNRIASLIGTAAGWSWSPRPVIATRNRISTTRLQAHALRPDGGVRALEDGQHPVRGGVRPAAQDARRAGDGPAPRRHPDRARSACGPGRRRPVGRADQRRPRCGRQAAFAWKTIPEGAATSVWAAFVASAEAVGGRYCENCHVSGITDGLITPVSEGVRSYALDPERARALWAKSEDLVGERY